MVSFQRLRQLNHHEREAERLGGGGGGLNQRPLNLAEDLRHFSPSLVKSDPFVLVFPGYWSSPLPVLGMLLAQSKGVTTKAHTDSFLCTAPGATLWHTDSFTWWRTPREATAFYRNRIITSPSLYICLSFMPVDTNNLSYSDDFFFYFSCICVIELHEVVIGSRINPIYGFLPLDKLESL